MHKTKNSRVDGLCSESEVRGYLPNHLCLGFVPETDRYKSTTSDEQCCLARKQKNNHSPFDDG